MFSFAADNQSDSEEEELDFSETRNKGAGLGNIFGGTSLTHKAESNAALVYQARQQAATSLGVGVTNQYRSPFSHTMWVVFVQLWAGTCVIFVTWNHISAALG